MSTISTHRGRASLALGTALALTAASLTIGMSPAAANGDVPPPVSFAKVTGYEPFSSEANKVGYWCEDGRKISPGGSSWVVDGNYSQIIVKAGSGKFANTVFGEPPTLGQTVWADTNGDGIFNPGGKGGDKGISHIILCGVTEPGPETTDLVVDKVWTYGEGVPTGFELDESDAGNLNVVIDEEEIDLDWGQTASKLPVEAPATVSEGTVKNPEGPAGFICAIEGAPTYQVNGEDVGTEVPTFPLSKEGNTVVVTNAVDCTEVEKPTTTLTVLKQWVPGDGVPPEYPTLDSDDAGTLKVTVNGESTEQAWNDTKAGLPIRGSAVVSETKPTLAAFEGYECTVSEPSYVINGGSASDAAAFELDKDPNTVTVVNAFDCKALVIPPPTTSLTVTKTWAYVGAPTGYALATTNAGPLTVTVGGTATGQAWGATTTGHTVGATAIVTEGTVPSIPQPTDSTYTCALTNTQYAVNAGAASTTASFTLAATPNTVVVTNTVTCTVPAVTPPAVTPPAVTPPAVTAPVPDVDQVEDVAVVEDIEEDATEESAVAGAESELAATGGNASAALLGALLVLSGAALIGSRRRFGMND